jgi:para-aminobenzoate synthetase/4-amino-4-deoxychorismate lyase
VPDPRAASGIFDTSLLHHGIPRERAEHVARLERACYELYEMPLPAPAFDALLRTAHDDRPWARLRIDVSAAGDVSVVTSAVAAPLPVAQQPGAAAIVLTSATGYGGYKWSDRREQAAAETANPGDIVILGDSDGLLESTRGNVVAVIDGRLVTAPLDGRVLPGVTRTVLLEAARDLGVDIELRLPHAREASGLAIVNSLIGMQWIRRCGDFSWDDPGELLRELSAHLVDRWTERATVAR